MKITLPKYLNDSEIRNFISNISFIFDSKDARIEGFILVLKNVKKMSLLGQLLIYKFVAYSATHRCFMNPYIYWNRKIKQELAKKGFLEIINTYMEDSKDTKKILQSYKKMRTCSNEFLFAPHRMLRSEENDKNKLEQEFLDSIKKYYTEEIKCSIVSQCIGELISNFWAHAIEESDTIIVACGTQDSIEVIFADNAKGIPHTLKISDTKYQQHTNVQLLEIACQEGVSSKIGTNHQGYGLFLIKELAINHNGQFSLYSADGYAQFSSKKQKTGNIGYWQGTIIHLRLDLKACKRIDVIMGKKIDERFIWE